MTSVQCISTYLKGSLSYIYVDLYCLFVLREKYCVLICSVDLFCEEIILRKNVRANLLHFNLYVMARTFYVLTGTSCFLYVLLFSLSTPQVLRRKQKPLDNSQVVYYYMLVASTAVSHSQTHSDYGFLCGIRIMSKHAAAAALSLSNSSICMVTPPGNACTYYPLAGLLNKFQKAHLVHCSKALIVIYIHIYTNRIKYMHIPYQERCLS